MKLFQKKKQSSVKVLNLDELLEIFILLIPYIGFIKELKNQYRKQDNGTSLYIIISTLLDTIKKDDLYKIISILLDCDIEKAKIVTMKEFIKILPKVFSENNLIEAYILLKNLGLIE